MRRARVLTYLLIFVMSGQVMAQTQPSVQAKAKTLGESVDHDAILMNAYKREFAFLEAERDALTKRLAALDSRMQTKVNQARGAVEAVQSRVANQDLDLNSLQGKLDAVDAEGEAEESPASFLSSLTSRASSALTQLGLKKIEKPNDPIASVPKGIKAVLDRVDAVLTRGQGLYRADAEFFDVSGTLVSGHIWHVGYVASYGIAAEKVGMLRPAGDGRLQLVNHLEGAASAQGVESGKLGQSVSLFLYENLEKSIEIPEAKTAESIIQAGGVIAYVIAGLGVFAFMLLLGRIVLLANYSRLALGVKKLMRTCSGQLGEAEHTHLKAMSGPHARVLKAVASTIKKPRQNQLDTFTEAFLTESPRLDRFSALILVLAAIAPLLGLLGTVTGMIATFDTITQFGTGNPKLLSGGISEALITTELGLIVAIPAVLFGNLLKGWSDQMKDTIEQLCLQTMNSVHMDGVQLVLEESIKSKPAPKQKSNVLAS
jgi:biopolymer transport protein ExbB